MLFDKIELENDERLLKIVRKHWFIPTIEFVGVGLLALAPFVVMTALMFANSQGWIELGIGAYWALLLFASSILWITCTMIAAMIWTHYYLDLWIITDRRLIVIEQLGFFHRRTSNFRLERLQDIKVRVNGILATLLNFGTIRAQTASAADTSFKMSGLPDPRNLQATMQKAMDDRIQRLETAQRSRSW